MNNSDAFILDGGKEQTIYVYQPQGASRMERFKAISGKITYEPLSYLVIVVFLRILNTLIMHVFLILPEFLPSLL